MGGGGEGAGVVRLRGAAEEEGEAGGEGFG